VVDQGLFPKRQIDEAPSTTSNMKKLFFHRVDLILATNGGAIYELSKLPYQKNEIEATYTLDEEFQFYFALNKQSDPGMIEKIRHAFDKVKASGLMENLRKKYSVD
jgi:polar amino acid transport system substrate-binding protein